MRRGRLVVVAAAHRRFSSNCSLCNLHHSCVQCDVLVCSQTRREPNCSEAFTLVQMCNT